jgi:hypothetical protein
MLSSRVLSLRGLFWPILFGCILLLKSLALAMCAAQIVNC